MIRSDIEPPDAILASDGRAARRLFLRRPNGSGTPVLGTRRGALPEVLSDEVAGFGDTLEELVAAIPDAEAKDPAACRARAERWFGHLRMAEEYVRFYRGWLAAGALPAGERTR